MEDQDKQANAVSKHTPGPWKKDYDNYGNDSYSEWIMIETDTKCIAQTCPTRQITKEDEANARLIVAAPALLEACKEIRDALNGPVNIAVAAEIFERLEAALELAKKGE